MSERPATMKPSCAKVLKLLRERPRTTGEFAEERCPRAGGRIHELRHIWGCEIEAQRIDSNAYLFSLKHEPPGLPVDGAERKPISPVNPRRVADRSVAVDRGAGARPVEQQLFDTIEIDIPPVRESYRDPDLEAA